MGKNDSITGYWDLFIIYAIDAIAGQQCNFIKWLSLKSLTTGVIFLQFFPG
jgi:hypothetical protein